MRAPADPIRACFERSCLPESRATWPVPLNLPLLRRKGAGHGAAGPALSRAFSLSRVLEWRLDTPSVCLWVCDTRPHVVPRADGGNPLERSNLVIASSDCNRRKGDLRLEEIGWSLIEPTDPGWMGLTDLYSVCGGCCRRHPCLCAAPSGPSREQS
jgi:hypothetical protein